jgi:hypothetical protein
MKTEKHKQQPKPQDAGKPQRDTEHGEGNYKASREYNDATRDFVKSGQVEQAAEKAKPRNQQEQEEMRKAEEAGRDRSKGEDPKLHKGGRKSSDIH